MSGHRSPRRTLDSYRKEAKRWMRALRAGDPAARARFAAALPDASPEPTLRDVQLALAREHGYPGWSALKVAHTDAGARAGLPSLADVDEKASVLLDAYTSGTPEAMERLYAHTWHRRSLEAFRTYVQLDLGKRPVAPGAPVAITLNDARYLIARGHGFESWQALEAFFADMPRRPVARPIRVVTPDPPQDSRTLHRSRDLDAILAELRRHRRAGLAGEGQVTDAMLRDIAGIETVTFLDLSGCRGVTDDGIRHLSRLPALEHLDLSGTSVTDAGIRVLRELPALRLLSLAWTRIGDEGLGVLAGCTRLEHLNLAGTTAGGGALAALAGKGTLRHLEIALGDAEMPLLRELPSFAGRGSESDDGQTTYSVFGVTGAPTHLSLRGTFTDRGLEVIGRLEGLYSLDVDDSRLAITARGLEPLTALPRLRALRVDAKDDWMPAIARLPHLRFLAAQDTTATDDGFVALAGSRSLEYLWGRRCHGLTRRGFQALATLPALRGLSVSCLNVDDSGVAALPSFPSLVELMPMDVPDAGFRHVGACRRLESLILMYCRETTDAATEHLTGLDALTYYFNSYTAITDRTPEILSTLDTLERVTLDTCHGLTDAGVGRLARLPNLRELRVTGRDITLEVAKAFPARVRVSWEP